MVGEFDRDRVECGDHRIYMWRGCMLLYSIYPGGGTQILFGRGCAAEASKPVPIFKGHFGGKGYPLLGIFSQENYVFVYVSDKMVGNI